ncbi:unnamed protein product [Larinioides sclopetarius]|uniref:Uncharacterized protein n=1 Tax=Larinioides sclopetarius TaxID=280406 RepID=A0AAV2BPL1_9ARAC
MVSSNDMAEQMMGPCIEQVSCAIRCKSWRELSFSRSPVSMFVFARLQARIYVKTEIMPRRKSNLGRRTRHTEGSRRRLSNMTEEERASVRERNRLSTIQTRNVDQAERRSGRLEDARLRAQLWERYRSHMAEDILHRVRLENVNMTLEFTEDIYNKALINIEDKCLAIANKVLSQLGMLAPTRTATVAFDVDLRREQSYNIDDLQTYVQSNIPKLTQQIVKDSN